MSNDEKALVPIETGWVMPPTVVKKRMGEIEEYRAIMREGEDYGTIPGTPKPTLYQPGADTLCIAAGLSVGEPMIERATEDWEGGFFYYLVKQPLMDSTGNIVAWGIGSCSSKEDRYAWRWIPVWEVSEEDKKRAEAEGWRKEWRYSKKRGKRFLFYRMANPDPYSQTNTVLKMAVKRAYISATLRATGAHRVFTQDIEDLPVAQRQPVAEVVDAEYEVVPPENGAPVPEDESVTPTEPEGTPAENAGEIMPRLRTNADLFNAGLKLGYKSRADMLTALGYKSEIEIADRFDAYKRLKEMAGR
jgi:hypothetical protein